MSVCVGVVQSPVWHVLWAVPHCVVVWSKMLIPPPPELLPRINLLCELDFSSDSLWPSGLFLREWKQASGLAIARKLPRPPLDPPLPRPRPRPLACPWNCPWNMVSVAFRRSLSLFSFFLSPFSSLSAKWCVYVSPCQWSIYFQSIHEAVSQMGLPGCKQPGRSDSLGVLVYFVVDLFQTSEVIVNALAISLLAWRDFAHVHSHRKSTSSAKAINVRSVFCILHMLASGMGQSYTVFWPACRCLSPIISHSHHQKSWACLSLPVFFYPSFLPLPSINWKPFS